MLIFENGGKVNIVPQKTAMYDDVFVNQEIVKKVCGWLYWKIKTEYDELINKIKEKFPNEYDFYATTYYGKYHDNHTKTAI